MDKCTCTTHKGFDELGAFVESLPNKKGELITVLHKAQSIFGYLPKEVQEFVADRLDLPLAKVYGVVKFYSFFSMTPKGRYPISVCMGTACYVRGAEEVLTELTRQLGISVGGVSEDGKFSLDTLRCVGACGLAPVVIVGEKVYGRVEPGKIAGILAEYAE
ncbi:NAD(P)H-dependent oxidoreductase subunit E [Dethiosulfovibrio sp. F2B]|uniref:NADH-quinone oxidoreductase subunit NuoE family protein n=1 Tax=Dethiosulfovibrio faecalis TaxID=2720018 RepID=UPI001F459060|nr:NAD(P)H-dependent oxidoreductase subunit E [Dethiosulfovibrio faecalis]MCF4152313.1 NAD(P)H-dependent oxidoreductase subunit E [Dethiosulfovibrio faecalis]